MENQGFPTIRIEKIMMKFLEKNLNLQRIGGTIWTVLPDLKRKKMGIKYDETTGLPSNDNTDYNTLLVMWRDEKKKREKAEDRIKELENSLSIALEINDKYQREEKKLKEELAREKDDREYDQLVHKRELADLFKGRWDPKMDGSGR